MLKPYLSDPGVVVAEWPETVEKRVFIVRQAAYDTLTGWGVDVPKPAIEPIPPRNLN